MSDVGPVTKLIEAAKAVRPFLTSHGRFVTTPEEVEADRTLRDALAACEGIEEERETQTPYSANPYRWVTRTPYRDDRLTIAYTGRDADG